MKKIALLLCAGIGLSGLNKASAQLQQGNLMVGASLADMKLGLQSGNTSFSLTIDPKIGYFIQDNIALGAAVELGFATDNTGTDIRYGVGAFGRYYVGDKRMVLMKHARFFGEANVGINGLNSDPKGSVGATNTNGLGIGFGPGVAYFLTPNIGLEALLKYDLTVGFGNSTTYNSFGLKVGFQIYLPSKKARSIYNDAADEINKNEED